ncbi:MAG: hypothetical protein R3B13_00615 [Polyangiaceae bacterium]
MFAKHSMTLVLGLGLFACASRCPEPAAPGASPAPSAVLLPDGRVRLADGREVSAAEAATLLPPGASLALESAPPVNAALADPPQTATTAAPTPATSAAPPPGEPPPAASSSATADAPPTGALPEVVVENVGLHIGGGPNDDATKAPFKAAIEQRFEDLRKCYVHAEEPAKGGTFGVDLFIGRNGGHPELRQPRTGMKGNEFRECVKRAFAAVEFTKPPRGPTVISYSVRFALR